MSRLGEALTVTDDPPVAALVVFDANPAASNPDHARVHAGLAREDLFTVVLEQRMTDTALFADIVLPATMQPEHLDLHTSYGHQYVTLNVPAVEPLGECRPNTEIFRGLARALGLDHPRLHESDEEIVRDVLDCDAARAAGITFERLRDEGALRIAERGRARFAEGGFPTPGGRLRLLAPELAESGADPLVGYTPPHELADSELAQRYPLALLSPASRHVMNSTFASLPWHRDRLGPPRVHLHPRDAEHRGIASGAHVRVHNDRGAFTAEAVIDDAARPGVAFTFKQQWPQLLGPGRHVNVTIPERDADLGGSPTFHDNRVEVSLLAEALVSGRGLQSAQAAGEGRHDRERDLRLAFEQLQELRAREHQRVDLADRDDRRRARLAVDQRHLAEEVAHSERDRPSRHLDANLAVEDDVERRRGVALAHERGTRGEALCGRDARDLADVAAGELGEERDVARACRPHPGRGPRWRAGRIRSSGPLLHTPSPCGVRV